MRTLGITILALAALSGAPARAGTCQTDGGQTCPSAMPLGGYCQCNVHGRNADGTIVSEASRKGTAKPFQPGASNAAGPDERRPPPPPPPPPGYPPQ